jgi:hypothetical protein
MIAIKRLHSSLVQDFDLQMKTIGKFSFNFEDENNSLLYRLKEIVELHRTGRYEMESLSSSLNYGEEIVVIGRVQMVQLVVHALDVPAAQNFRRINNQNH